MQNAIFDILTCLVIFHATPVAIETSTKNFNLLTIKHISDDLNQTYEFKIRLVKQLSPTLSSKVKQAYARF